MGERGGEGKRRSEGMPRAVHVPCTKLANQHNRTHLRSCLRWDSKPMIKRAWPGHGDRTLARKNGRLN